MRRGNYLLLPLLSMGLLLLGMSPAAAAAVGTIIQVEGQVDLLRGGRLPVTPARLQEPVAVGDVVRTKSQSRAQIKFVDDTVLTIAPESRVTIEEYMFDGAKGERKATLQVLRGMVHTAVEKVFPKEEPDFIIKTHTAVLGVRGTRWFTVLFPVATDVYTEEGSVQVQNLLPEIPGIQILSGLQYCRIGLFLPPTLPLPISRQDLKFLEQMMKSGTGASSQTGGAPEPTTGVTGPPLTRMNFGQPSLIENLTGGTFVPPRIGPPPPPPIKIEGERPYTPPRDGNGIGY